MIDWEWLEAKGRLLATLITAKAFRVYAEEPEEEAGLVILELIQTKREFREVCEHLTTDGTTIPYEEGRRKLDAFFDGRVWWLNDEQNRYEDRMREVGARFAALETPYPTNLPPNTPVQRTNIRMA